jgi:NAD+ kinase
MLCRVEQLGGDGGPVRVAVVTHPTRVEAAAAAEHLAALCAGRAVVQAVDVWADDFDAEHAVAALGNSRPELVVTFGGDGTFLRGIAFAVPADARVLGLNVRRVGFLPPTELADLPDVLPAALDGTAHIEQRMLLTLRASRPLEIPPDVGTLLRYGRGPAPAPPKLRRTLPQDVGWGVALQVTALNDVVFEKLGRDRQASLGVYLSSRLFATYSADALIVSSPTGSTAYSFAAGGPVLSPRLDALVFTPVAPHMAFNRSIVTAPDEAIAVRVLQRSGQVAVVVDGHVQGVLDPGDWVGVYPSARRARIIEPDDQDFFGRLRDRFSLANAPAAAADGDAPLVYRPNLPVPEDLRHLHLPPPE